MRSKRFIHRDIKPQNILFDLEGSFVKLGDFGLATLSNQQEPSSHSFPWTPRPGHTQSVGTSLYAAPEQCEQACYDSKIIEDLKAELKEKDKRMTFMANEVFLLRSEIAKLQLELKWYQPR
ncbi:hypothetical protein V5799_023597 [Amblyomma americanum]|uniref:Protein kinase domain-containing protein n=1 Tax=Amblyomma americanum TaxID=6943 RepID=A0AAQ4FI04_AMBAM